MPKIAVFAGHGGSDPGAVSGGLYEKDFNLALSNKVSEILKSRGYAVINNRTADVDRSITADANLANAENVDGVVEIHMNSNEGAPQNGTETYYSIYDTGTGRSLANAINSRIVDLGFTDRGIKTRTNANGQDYFGIIRQTNSPAVLVETAFLNSPSDMERFDTDAISLAIADGIQSVFPVGEPSPQPPEPLPPGEDSVMRDFQATLNANYNTNIPITGVYDQATNHAAVTGLQIELNKQYGRGLSVDGIFGPATLAAAVNVRPGARGNLTYIIQGALYGHGYHGALPDSVYGQKTAVAVAAFQNDYGLGVDTIAGPLTQQALFTR